MFGGMREHTTGGLYWRPDLWGDRVPLWGGIVIRPRLDLGVQPVLVLVPEGRVAHQQDVQYHTWQHITQWSACCSLLCTAAATPANAHHRPRYQQASRTVPSLEPQVRGSLASQQTLKHNQIATRHSICDFSYAASQHVTHQTRPADPPELRLPARSLPA